MIVTTQFGFVYICVRIYILPLLLCNEKCMSKWDRALYQMPTVEINILWDGAGCCFQIAQILSIFAAFFINGIFNLWLPPMYAIVIIPLLRVCLSF